MWQKCESNCCREGQQPIIDYTHIQGMDGCIDGCMDACMDGWMDLVVGIGTAIGISGCQLPKCMVGVIILELSYISIGDMGGTNTLRNYMSLPKVETTTK